MCCARPRRNFAVLKIIKIRGIFLRSFSLTGAQILANERSQFELAPMSEGSRFKHLLAEHWAPVIQADVNSSSSDETQSCELQIVEESQSPKRNSGTLMNWRDHGFTFVQNYDDDPNAIEDLYPASQPSTNASAKLPGSRFAYLLSEHALQASGEETDASHSGNHDAGTVGKTGQVTGHHLHQDKL